MAALPNVQNVMRLGFTGTLNNQPFFTGTHVKYSGPSLDVTALNAMCLTWANTWGTYLSPIMSSGATLRTVEAWDLSSPAGTYGSANTSKAGTLAGNDLTNSVAQCISLKVNYRWRGGHPRMYLPPPTRAETVNGTQWTAGFQSTAQAAVRTWLTGMNNASSGGTTFKVCCVRYINAKQIINPPLVLEVADVLVHSRIDSQRRRLGKEII